MVEPGLYGDGTVACYCDNATRRALGQRRIIRKFVHIKQLLNLEQI